MQLFGKGFLCGRDTLSFCLTVSIYLPFLFELQRIDVVVHCNSFEFVI